MAQKKIRSSEVVSVKSSRTSFRIKKIGLIIKHHQPEAAAFAMDVAEVLVAEKVQLFFADESKVLARDIARTLGTSRGQIQTVAKTKLPEVCDLIVVLGGDGTFLSIARLMREKSIPIMGVNMGQLGFLTEIKQDEAIEELQKMIRGTTPLIHTRALLQITLRRKNKIILQEPVVNDAVISKGAIARIIGMQIWVDGQWVSHLRADGMIVSTTTGATAYALAAGGPIVEPSVPALIIAPICAHSLTFRPLVIPDTSEVKICLNHRPGHVLLTLDGQDAIDMKEGDIVTIQRFQKHPLKLISSPTRDYFSILREKLKFGVRD